MGIRVGQLLLTALFFKIIVIRKIILLLLVSVALFSCDRFRNKETDGKKDLRIVSLSKHLTEMIFALGKGHDLVAVDLSSSFPDSAKLLKTVGYHRALSPESIIAMNPELVLNLMKDHTVLIAVMHDINLAAHYADNLFFLKEGEMVVHGRPKDILTENIIEKVFNVKTKVIENPVTGKPLEIYN